MFFRVIWNKGAFSSFLPLFLRIVALRSQRQAARKTVHQETSWKGSLSEGPFAGLVTECFGDGSLSRSQLTSVDVPTDPRQITDS